MTITADSLTADGLFHDLPGTTSVDHFLAALCTRVFGPGALDGAALLKVTTKGTWEVVGCFSALCQGTHSLEGSLAMNSAPLMAALRDGSVTLSPEDTASLTSAAGHATALGLARPHFGVLLFVSGTPLDLSPEATSLLRTAGELWLGRGSGATTTVSPQVDASTSGIIFTDRQREVLALLSQGLTNAEIGRQLAISASLAKQEVAFLAHALQAKNRLDVVVQAQRQGILAVGGR